MRIEPREWFAEAEAMMERYESRRDMSAIRADVQAGAAVLFAVERVEDGMLVAVVVLRIDAGPDRSEGVIVSAAGMPGFDLTREVLPSIEKRFEGVESIRIHTARPGLCRRLVRAGYEASEIVMRKRVM